MQKKALDSTWQTTRNKFNIFCQAILNFVASNTFLYITFFWFVLVTIFFTININFGIPPDEYYHFTFIKAFAENSFSPFLDINNNYYVLYDMTVKTPFYLYHYLLSFPYQLVKDSENAFIALRLINVVLGVLTLWIVMKITNLVKTSNLARNIVIFMIANTLMFTFLFASISYDNLFTFLSVAAVYLLLRLLNKITAKDLLLFLITIAAGLLVKINFLPMAFSLVVVFLWSYYKDLKQIFIKFKRTFKKNKILNSFSILVLLLLCFSVLNSYVGNILEYKTPFPKCDQTIDIKECRKNKLFVRNEIIKETRKEPVLSLPAYTFNWFTLMNQRTFGIFAHKKILPNKFIEYSIYLIIFIFFIAFVRKFKRNDKLMYVVFLICLFNILILLFENFNIYKNTGRSSFAIHGRYIFGILPLIYIVGVSYFTKLKINTNLKCILVVFILLIFFLASLPTYIKKSNEQWHSKETTIYMNYLKEII